MTENDFVHMRPADLEALLEQAATRGATLALAAVGLHDDAAGADVRDLRKLLESWRAVSNAARKAAAETLATLAAKALLTAILAAVAVAWWRS